MRRKLLLIAAILLIGASAVLYFLHSFGGLRSIVVKQVGRKIISDAAESDLIQKALGFTAPQTYLVLFLNNTEIRPAGGFIGAYSVVRIDKGMPQILKVEGSEILDNLGSRDFSSVPPEPLRKYLSIKRWGFRDSNWSPDFSSSAVKALDLFKKEKGMAADEISAVIGITPTLIEEILKIGGPILINGKEFTPHNFTEKLEYEVEFGYAKQGLEFNDRKKILADLTRALLVRVSGDVFVHWPRYFALAQRMLAEKHILIYSKDPEIGRVLLAKNWAGEIQQTNADYLLWADANLASLKTDKVMDRELFYSFAPTSSGKYAATVKMKYFNKGSFTEFTTRYRTYARIFLPVGSRFISVDDGLPAGQTRYDADQGIENNKQWFGAFTSIEPGKTGKLVWRFYLSPSVVERIKNNSYNLFVQKQAGTIANALTLDLNFDKNIASAVPGEAPADSGNKSYNYKTDLRLDREFNLNFK
jgi:hypothetical protein